MFAQANLMVNLKSIGENWSKKNYEQELEPEKLVKFADTNRSISVWPMAITTTLLQWELIENYLLVG